jgi:putative oxidoreductase
VNVTVIPAAWTPYLQAILRIMTGLLFLEHGTSKILGFPLAPGAEHVMPQGMVLFSGAMELVGGALIVVGFLTRPTAFVLSGFMAAAYFIAHFPAGFFPLLNHGETAILYCFVFLYFAAAGPSVWAVDKA